MRDLKANEERARRQPQLLLEEMHQRIAEVEAARGRNNRDDPLTLLKFKLIEIELQKVKDEAKAEI